MDESLLPLDIYPMIFSHLDWFNLVKSKKINKFCYSVSKKLISKKIRSNYPFGEPNSKVEIYSNDCYIEDIVCTLENGNLKIPKDYYSLPWLRDMLHEWFIYSFQNRKFNITSKLFKSIIRVLNRKMSDNFRIDETYQILTFRFINSETVLEDVK